MKQEFQFCIPSYKRADRQKTLDLLERLSIPKEWITLSVQTMQDLQDYKRAGVGKRVNQILYREGENVSDNMNTLLDAFPKGERIVILEDDIKDILRLSISPDGKHRKLIPVTDGEQFLKICRNGFATAKLNGTVAFGLNLFSNAMFMRKGYHKRKLCDTAFYGMVNSDLRFDRNLSLFQDTDMCLRIIKRYGAFISIEGYCAKHERQVEGGCYSFWTKKNMDDMAEIIRKKHGELVDIDMSRINLITLKRSRK